MDLLIWIFVWGLLGYVFFFEMIVCFYGLKLKKRLYCLEADNSLLSGEVEDLRERLLVKRKRGRKRKSVGSVGRIRFVN